MFTESDIPGGMLALFRAWEDTLPGWCFVPKMVQMAGLVLREQPQLCIEVGVYGGRSALPVAAALRHNRKGLLRAADPYSGTEALKGTLPPSEAWWGAADLNEVLALFLQARLVSGLEPWLEFDRVPSALFLARLAPDSVDVAHVDANHSEEGALADVTATWAALKPDGWLWLDDTDWSSLRPALNWLDSARAEQVADFTRFRLYRKPARLGSSGSPGTEPTP